MTQPSQNNYIQQSLDTLSKKIDDLIASMPNQYVTIRNHELQIKAHEERINENAKRLDALETSTEAWKNAAGQWSVNQHETMRKEWTMEVKDVNNKLDNVEISVVSVEKSMIKMTEQQNNQTKILLWVLGIFTTLMLTGVSVVIVALTNHLIHF